MIIIIILLIILYFINKKKESFNIFDENKIYNENMCLQNNKDFSSIHKMINNSIFMDDKLLASKNKFNKINENYTLIGQAINPYSTINYLLFEKYYKNNLFYYILINKTNKIDYMPPRDKIYLDDIIFIKNYGYFKIINI